ncbi:protein-L-isoaspartate(D-aspartate) O-methyltransferase [Rhodobacter aestuarii]|uniref:Protein-L-isoaspartate O-methyltransferase n=1 Tax=Rhodobacter aestuarii TaxID=453582 RepID=A0A1N7K3R4_9RHOB|nr:protein-L-isoaspartate O-methyltransferase [Rhodobacter aestuarii]PTV95871.1 protein-L-isoaspartate(D-aspartate) O-methyltransferase [Rhodobacter aestuarii]SIS56176.1 protein-L-isoaspartate(D-aspartate) O-methyltransferase [Rhodobacter aestuarii]
MQDFATRRTMMVDTQVRPNDVTKFPIIEAMLTVPREDFVPAGRREAAYVGENIELESGRVLLEPRNFAKMLDAIDIQPADLVLDIGAGMGYSAAVIARMAEAVVALETEEMAPKAEAQLAIHDVDNAAVVAGVLSEGAPQHGPYDAIVIEGGVETVPAAIEAQLKEGGRIIAIFMQDALGTVRLGRKIDDVVVWRDVFNAAAPLLEGFTLAKEFVL